VVPPASRHPPEDISRPVAVAAKKGADVVKSEKIGLQPMAEPASSFLGLYGGHSRRAGGMREVGLRIGPVLEVSNLRFIKEASATVDTILDQSRFGLVCSFGRAVHIVITTRQDF